MGRKENITFHICEFCDLSLDFETREKCEKEDFILIFYNGRNAG